MDITLSALPGSYSIVRLDEDSDIPAWATSSAFFSVTKTDDELSIVCEDESVPEEVKAERNWRMFKVAGPLDLSLTGIASSILKPLAEAEIGVFVISTHDTDYILVKNDRFEEAKTVLSEHFTVN